MKYSTKATKKVNARAKRINIERAFVRGCEKAEMLHTLTMESQIALGYFK